MTAVKSEHVDAPVIQEFPLCLECEFIEYQEGEYGCGVIGKVVNTTADERVMDDDELISLRLMQLHLTHIHMATIGLRRESRSI